MEIPMIYSGGQKRGARCACGGTRYFRKTLNNYRCYRCGKITTHFYETKEAMIKAMNRLPDDIRAQIDISGLDYPKEDIKLEAR
jgi:hypothetical protein